MSITHIIDWSTVADEDPDCPERLLDESSYEEPDTPDAAEREYRRRERYHMARVEREENQSVFSRRYRDGTSGRTREAMARLFPHVHARRVRIAKVLAGGPKTVKEIMRATGLKYNQVAHAVQHPWFRREGWWHVALTDEGKRVLGEKE